MCAAGFSTRAGLTLMCVWILFFISWLALVSIFNGFFSVKLVKGIFVILGFPGFVFALDYVFSRSSRSIQSKRKNLFGLGMQLVSV